MNVFVEPLESFLCDFVKEQPYSSDNLIHIGIKLRLLINVNG